MHYIHYVSEECLPSVCSTSVFQLKLTNKVPLKQYGRTFDSQIKFSLFFFLISYIEKCTYICTIAIHTNISLRFNLRRTFEPVLMAFKKEETLKEIVDLISKIPVSYLAQRFQFKAISQSSSATVHVVAVYKYNLKRK